MKDDQSVRPKVLLFCYACEPHQGSEPGTGWNMAIGLSRFCSVTVATRANNREIIEAELSKIPTNNLTFIYIDPPIIFIKLKKWGLLPTQLFYFFWQVSLARMLRNGDKIDDYDIIHQLTFNSFEVPPFAFLKKSKAQYVWGPIGGGQRVPLNHLALFGFKGGLLEFLRNLRVAVSSLNPLCILALRNSAIVYFANLETRHLLGRWCGGEVEMMIDVGANTQMFQPRSEKTRDNEIPIILFGGRLEGRKGAMLLLRTILQLVETNKAFECRIVGGGPDKDKIERFIDRHHLGDYVKLLGVVPHDQMIQEFGHADIFIFPSMRDTSGAIVLESMATSLPCVCLDHQGAALMVNEDSGMKVRPAGISQMTDDLSGCLFKLLDQPELRASYGHEARKRVMREYDWSVRHEKTIKSYRKLQGLSED